MKRYLLTLTVTLAIVISASVGARSAEGVRYINSDQLRLEYVGARDLDAQLEASVADWRTEAREKERE